MLTDEICDVVLRDGSTLALRPVQPNDVDALVAFFEALSPESRYFRFFGIPKLDRASVARLVPATSEGGMALVGDCSGRVVAFPPGLARIPCYAFPESAAVALGRVTAYGEWKQKAVGTVPAFDDMRGDDARAFVESALQRGGGWLTPSETEGLLSAVGITLAPARVVVTAQEAVVAASALGYPVALKAIGPTILHKTERQAVHLNLEGEHAVRDTALDFEARFRGELTGLLVQRIIQGGVEMLVGAVYDQTFGPVVVCGTGGVFVDLLADSAFRLHPVTSDDAADMIQELKGARLLCGYRGAAPVDEAALRDVVLRVSALLTLCPEIHELDLNPLKVLPSGACAIDARVRVERRTPRPSARRVEY